MRKDFTINHMNELIDHVEAVLSPIDEIGNILIGIVDFLVPWWEREAQVLAKSRNEVIAIFEEVSSLDTSYAGYVQDHDRDIRMPVERYIAELANTVRPGTTGFSYGPNKIDSMIDSLPHSALPFEGGDDGTYGGNQMKFSPGDENAILRALKRCFDPSQMSEEEFQKYKAFIGEHKGFENPTDETVWNVLNAATESCGYIALCNSLFAEYDGREEDFEKVFGYPMYKDYPKNTEPNYEMLELDLMCASMDPNSVDGSTAPITTVDKDKNGSNKTIPGRGEILREFLNQKRAEHANEGLYIPIPKHETYLDVNLDNLDQVRNNGEVIIHTNSNVHLHNDKDPDHIIGGGHAMSLVGTTEDNQFIVSSWGQEWYLDPSDSLVELGSDNYAYYANDGNRYYIQSNQDNSCSVYLQNGGSNNSKTFLYRIKEDGWKGSANEKTGSIAIDADSSYSRSFMDENGNPISAPQDVPFSWYPGKPKEWNMLGFEKITYQEAYS